MKGAAGSILWLDRPPTTPENILSTNRLCCQIRESGRGSLVPGSRVKGRTCRWVSLEGLFRGLRPETTAAHRNVNGVSPHQHLTPTHIRGGSREPSSTRSRREDGRLQRRREGAHTRRKKQKKQKHGAANKRQPSPRRTFSHLVSPPPIQG